MAAGSDDRGARSAWLVDRAACNRRSPRRPRGRRQHGRGAGAYASGWRASPWTDPAPSCPVSTAMADAFRQAQSRRAGQPCTSREPAAASRSSVPARSTSPAHRVRSTPPRAAQCETSRRRAHRAAVRIRQPGGGHQPANTFATCLTVAELKKMWEPAAERKSDELAPGSD